MGFFPRASQCFRLNFNVSKLGYCKRCLKFYDCPPFVNNELSQNLLQILLCPCVFIKFTLISLASSYINCVCCLVEPMTFLQQPERIDPPDPMNPDYDVRADVWSLGITLVRQCCVHKNILMWREGGGVA